MSVFFFTDGKHSGFHHPICSLGAFADVFIRWRNFPSTASSWMLSSWQVCLCYLQCRMRIIIPTLWGLLRITMGNIMMSSTGPGTHRLLSFAGSSRVRLTWGCSPASQASTSDAHGQVLRLSKPQLPYLYSGDNKRTCFVGLLHRPWQVTVDVT